MGTIVTIRIPSLNNQDDSWNVMSHGFLTRSSNGCEIQEPTCMKLDAATDPSGRDHSLGTQGRHWDYCSSLRAEDQLLELVE